MTDEPDSKGGPSVAAEASDATKPHVESADLTLDQLFEALADSRRRYVLSYLAETTDGVAGFTELIAEVVARDSEFDPDGAVGQYEAVAADLRHAHLPKLEAAGLLDYDERSQTVRYYGHPRLETYLALASERDSRTGKG